MSIRFSEEEALRAGFRRSPKGEWYMPAPGGGPPTSFLNRNTGQVSEWQRRVRGQGEGKARKKKNVPERRRASLHRDGERYEIFVTAFCYRDTDPDNIIPKWFIDELVRQGVIPDDSSKYVRNIFKEVEVIGSEEKERTLIEVFAVREEDAG